MMDCFKIHDDANTDALQIDILQTSIKLLSVYCIWPKGNIDFQYICKFTLMLFSLSLSLIGCYCHVYYIVVIREGSWVYIDIADDVSSIISATSMCVIIFYYVSNVTKLKALIKELGNFTHFEKPMYVERLNNRLNLFAIIVILWMMLSGLYVCIYLYWQECEDGVVELCGLLISAYLPIDIFRSPHRQIFMLIQVYAGFSFGFIGFFMSLSVLSSSYFFKNRMEHLAKLLKVIPELPTRRQRKQQIKKSILYHYKIIELWEDYCIIYIKFFSTHIINSPIIISAILYLLIDELRYQQVVHLLLWIVTLGLTCAFGQKLLDASEDLHANLWLCLPFDGDNETIRDLGIIMLRSSKPLIIPIGKFGIFNYSAFVAILKTIYSVLTILLQTKED